MRIGASVTSTCAIPTAMNCLLLARWPRRQSEENFCNISLSRSTVAGYLFKEELLEWEPFKKILCIEDLAGSKSSCHMLTSRNDTLHGLHREWSRDRIDCRVPLPSCVALRLPSRRSRPSGTSELADRSRLQPSGRAYADRAVQPAERGSSTCRCRMQS
jgi:hypothetical protein